MQNTINAIRADFTRVSNEFRNHWHRELNRISEKSAVAVMTWLLSKWQVQKVVADTFRADTPLCRVFTDAIENNRDKKVDTDDIEGLDRCIEDAIDSAFNDRSFTDAVKEAIDLEELVESIDLDLLAEKVSERVVDELVRKLTR